jgi:hypothetical protein
MKTSGIIHTLTAQTSNDFDRFQSLQIAYHASDCSKYTSFFACAHCLSGRGFGEETPVAGSGLAIIVDTKLAFELLSSATDQWLSQCNGSVGE